MIEQRVNNTNVLLKLLINPCYCGCERLQVPVRNLPSQTHFLTVFGTKQNLLFRLSGKVHPIFKIEVEWSISSGGDGIPTPELKRFQ